MLLQYALGFLDISWGAMWTSDWSITLFASISLINSFKKMLAVKCLGSLKKPLTSFFSFLGTWWLFTTVQVYTRGLSLGEVGANKLSYQLLGKKLLTS